MKSYLKPTIEHCTLSTSARALINRISLENSILKGMVKELISYCVL